MLLPIANYKNDIIEAVNSHYFTIVSAETGSGKSTQIPQYLAEHYNRVIVTEPRIMAAKTLAKRVAEEMQEQLGEKVGYKTAYDKCSSPDSKIVYCTDGLQLIKTIFSQDTENKNILIIDEVHEWNLNIETLIAWCKFMEGKWNTKVVIMSATFDTIKLADFLGDDVAVLNLPGNLYDVTIEEREEFMLVGTIIENVNKHKNVLVFVAGKKEIHDVMERLGDEKVNATVLPLHGEMDWEDQKKCFEQYNNPKVIVATNVAQTSITISDIDVVVDTGLARISNVEDGIQGLFLSNISYADIIQRKGRAGRTKEGKYFLCSDRSIASRNKESIPEIQRSILDRVVLQLAEIGLDAEKLKFYHQPTSKAIVTAKKELNAIGAIENGKVTDIGHKIAKMPVSVQLARMIIEAEKYGVTEPVLTIAAIIEIGGLLTKETSYSCFTSESKSDLLAELDVWNFINKSRYVDFEKYGIYKKNFFKIKDHIKKLKEVLYGTVEISNTGNREAIIKSCLHGLVSNIYVKDYNEYISYDQKHVKLNRNSCINPYLAEIVVGIPKTIEYKTRYYGWNSSMTLLTFATTIDVAMLLNLVPNQVEEEVKLRYSKSVDAVEVTVKRSFAEIEVDSSIEIVKDHPEYNRLKEEFENGTVVNNSQKMVVIDGKQFQVFYDFLEKRSVIMIDDETLFTTKEREIFLDSGEKLYFSSNYFFGKPRRECNIATLKKAVEIKRLNYLRKQKTMECDSVNLDSINDVVSAADTIGKTKLTMDNGGFGDTPIFVYSYMELKQNRVNLKITDDEELANSSNLEALQYLFLKEIENKYGESKFSHKPGKKKKVLTKSEIEVKKDFDSLVRELANDLTISNVTDTLEFLEEYYQELMIE